MIEDKFIIVTGDQVDFQEYNQYVEAINDSWQMKFVCPYCGSTEAVVTIDYGFNSFMPIPVHNFEVTCKGCKGISEYYAISPFKDYLPQIKGVRAMFNRWYQRVWITHYIKSVLPEQFVAMMKMHNDVDCIGINS